MIWTDYSDNRYSPSEGTVLARDKYSAGSGVTIFCHGAESGTGGSYQWMSLPTRQKMFRALCSLGPVLIPDLGGNSTWGNDIAIGRMDHAYSYAQSQFGVSKIRIFAQSMGNATACAWARTNKTKIEKLASIIPVINIQEIRDNSQYQSAIDSAYAPSGYSDSTYGNTHSPLLIARSGGLNGVEMKVWYGGADTLCKPIYSSEFISYISGCKYSVLRGGHQEATLLEVSESEIVEFFND